MDVNIVRIQEVLAMVKIHEDYEVLQESCAMKAHYLRRPKYSTTNCITNPTFGREILDLYRRRGHPKKKCLAHKEGLIDHS